MTSSSFPQVRNLIDQYGLDAVLFLHLPNLRYLCNFSGTDGALIVGEDRTCFLTDSRYTTQASTQVNADEIKEYAAKIDGVLEYLRSQGAKRVGFESETTPFGFHSRLQEAGGAQLEWVPLGKPLQRLRGRKSTAELEILAEAARIAAAGFQQILPRIRPGIRECDLALELEFAVKRLGAEEKAFDFIVASGARGALPHGIASDKVLAAGELVTIDYGVRYRGYHSDETVTLAIGEVPERLKTVYDIVLAAHDRALDQVRPGISLKDLDAIARDYIQDQGFGAYFGHGLGHGVGLEIHEFPAVSSRSEDILEEGMVITIEPGIYLPEEGGVRIEDTVAVTADGYRCLTLLPKNFQVL